MYQIDETLLEEIKIGENVVITSIPGAGLNTYFSVIRAKIAEDNNLNLIEIFPYEEFDSIEHYLSNKSNGTKNIITIRRLEYHPDPKLLLKSVDRFQVNQKGKYQILITANSDTVHANKKYAQRLFRNIYEFKRFEGVDYSLLVKNLTKQMKVDLPNAISQEIETLTNGHTGLTKALIKHYKNEHTLENLLDNTDITQRLDEISSAHNTLEISTPHCKLHKAYENQFTGQESAVNEFTATELHIYTEIIKAKNYYVTIDQIIDTLPEEKREQTSNWGIYKHISNMNKKLVNDGKLIRSKKGRGYYLETR